MKKLFVVLILVVLGVVAFYLFSNKSSKSDSSGSQSVNDECRIGNFALKESETYSEGMRRFIDTCYISIGLDYPDDFVLEGAFSGNEVAAKQYYKGIITAGGLSVVFNEETRVLDDITKTFFEKELLEAIPFDNIISGEEAVDIAEKSMDSALGFYKSNTPPKKIIVGNKISNVYEKDAALLAWTFVVETEKGDSFAFLIDSNSGEILNKRRQ